MQEILIATQLFYKKSIRQVGTTANTNLRQNFRSHDKEINKKLLQNVVTQANGTETVKDTDKLEHCLLRAP